VQERLKCSKLVKKVTQKQLFLKKKTEGKIS